jgi:hypothetical protein
MKEKNKNIMEITKMEDSSKEKSKTKESNKKMVNSNKEIRETMKESNKKAINRANDKTIKLNHKIKITT